MTIEPIIGKEASREIVELGKMNFAFRMIDDGKPRLLLRPQRAGRVKMWVGRPKMWLVNRDWYDTRAQAARAANTCPRCGHIATHNKRCDVDG